MLVQYKRSKLSKYVHFFAIAQTINDIYQSQRVMEFSETIF